MSILKRSKATYDPDDESTWPNGEYVIDRSKSNVLTNVDYSLRIEVIEGTSTLPQESMQVALLMDIRDRLDELIKLNTQSSSESNSQPNPDSAKMQQAIDYVFYGKRDHWDNLADKVKDSGGVDLPDDHIFD